MITDEDTTKLVNKIVEVNKKLFYTKDEMDIKFEGIRTDFSKLQTSVDSFVKVSKKNEDQILILNKRQADHSSWTKKAAPKIGVEFKP